MSSSSSKKNNLSSPLPPQMSRISRFAGQCPSPSFPPSSNCGVVDSGHRRRRHHRGAVVTMATTGCDHCCCWWIAVVFLCVLNCGLVKSGWQEDARPRSIVHLGRKLKYIFYSHSITDGALTCSLRITALLALHNHSCSVLLYGVAFLMLEGSS